MFSLSLIEHLKEPEKHIKEIHRVLKRKGIFIIQIPNLQYIFEPHSKWPFLFLFPRRIQLIIFKTLNYPLFVNMKVNIKKTLLLLQEEKFKIREIKKVYHLTIMKLLPIAPSYIIISEKC
jgi:predicted SAM-dependent methyltransferase